MNCQSDRGEERKKGRKKGLERSWSLCTLYLLACQVRVTAGLVLFPIQMCAFVCLYVEPVLTSKDYVRSWIKIGSVLCLWFCLMHVCCRVCLNWKVYTYIYLSDYISISIYIFISGAVWESRWPPWAVRPNEPSGFRGRKAILNHASALVSACP